MNSMQICKHTLHLSLCQDASVHYLEKIALLFSQGPISGIFFSVPFMVE